MLFLNRIFPIFIAVLLFSCQAYKQDIMFQFDQNFTEEDVSQVKQELEQNYLLKSGDRLQLDVFTNSGERLIDPNFEISSLTGGQGAQQFQQQRDRFEYIIQVDGMVTFPLVGNLNLTGKTLYEAELLVAEKFGDYYEDTFVKLRISNRRAFVLGASGGQVIPLLDENTSLFEVLSLSQAINRNAKAHNIRLIRGNDVFLINLSTITGMKATNMNVLPGDVVYVEPWRRPWVESLRDASPIISIISSIVTLAVIVQNF